MAERLTETVIVKRVKGFLINKPNGNWHDHTAREAGLHGHGPDLVLTGGRRNSEYFIVECKGRSYAQSAEEMVQWKN